jgi:hypothetical protein
MGGLAARYYLAHSELWPQNQGWQPEHRIKKLFTLGTPHEGTDIHLLHPVGSNVAEFSNYQCNKDICTNYYKLEKPYNYMMWSTALRQMTAKWKDPDQWVNATGQLREVMPRAERLIACDRRVLSGPAWLELCNLFPPDSNKRSLASHVEYYNSMIAKLTTTGGVSPFLEELNSRPMPADVDYYLIAGNNPKTVWFPLCLEIEVPRITNGDLGDGVVPLRSALGKDLYFPKVKKAVIDAHHTQLPRKGKDRVRAYLKAAPL